MLTIRRAGDVSAVVGVGVRFAGDLPISALIGDVV